MNEALAFITYKYVKEARKAACMSKNEKTFKINKEVSNSSPNDTSRCYCINVVGCINGCWSLIAPIGKPLLNGFR